MTSESDIPTIEQYRRFYADEICAVANLTDPRLVEAFARVPREKFLGPGPWELTGEMFLQPAGRRQTSDPRDLYHNVVVAIRKAKNLNNGQPSALAGWIAALGVKEGNRVYHLGCGTGYYTAILCEVAGPEGTVVAVEVDAELAAE